MTDLILIALGFILCGFIIGFTYGFSIGQRHILRKIERQNKRQSPTVSTPVHPNTRCYEKSRDVLDAEFIEEIKR